MPFPQLAPRRRRPRRRTSAFCSYRRYDSSFRLVCFTTSAASDSGTFSSLPTVSPSTALRGHLWRVRSTCMCRLFPPHSTPLYPRFVSVRVFHYPPWLASLFALFLAVICCVAGSDRFASRSPQYIAAQDVFIKRQDLERLQLLSGGSNSDAVLLREM